MTELVDEPRGDQTREWEVFVRESAADSLTHVGSVSAPTASVAREQAEQLFGWTAAAVWLCPADETRRFTDESLTLAGEREETGEATEGGEATGDSAEGGEA